MKILVCEWASGFTHRHGLDLSAKRRRECNISWLPLLAVAAFVKLHDERECRQQWGLT